MWLQPRPPFLLASLLFVTAVQAAPNEPPAPGKGSVVSAPAPKPQLHGITNMKGSGSRYGIGYEARHGVDTEGARSERVDRMERPERPEPVERMERPERPEPVERMERPERVERGDRGR
jgi:hypothetical protein